MRHALMYCGFDFVEGTMVPPIKYGECNWDEGIPPRRATSVHRRLSHARGRRVGVCQQRARQRERCQVRGR